MNTSTNDSTTVEMKSKLEKDFINVVHQNSANIVRYCGGLANMVQLCLLWNKLNAHSDNNVNMDALRKLLNENEMNLDSYLTYLLQNLPQTDIFGNLTDPDTYGDDSNVLSLGTTEFTNVMAIKPNENSMTDIAVGKINSTPRSTKQSQSITASTVDEYHTSKIIIKCDKKNNLCFKWFSQSNFINPSQFHDVIYSKFYAFAMFGTAVICRTLSEIIASMDQLENYIGIASIFHLVGALVFAIHGLSFMLLSNICVMGLIMKTFDFWFKIINSLSTLIALEMLLAGTNEFPIHSIPTSIRIIGHISLLFILLVVCTYDAISISFKIKFRCGIVVSMYVFTWVVYTYFMVEDVVWNPFHSYNFKYSRISFKSLYMSSNINLGLFVLKPFVIQLVRYLTKKVSDICKCHVCSCNRNNRDNILRDVHNSTSRNIRSNAKYERCSSVYKRPYVQWE